MGVQTIATPADGGAESITERLAAVEAQLAGLAAILVFRLRLGVAALVALFAAAGAALSAAGLVP